MLDTKALSGIWRSTYRYTSSGRDNQEFEGQHYVRAHSQGRRLVFESVPDSKSYVLIRLSFDGEAATGSWEEQTDPNGYYKGATYYGAIQFMVTKDGKGLSGKWAGFGKEGDVNTGPWRLEYIGEALPAA